MPEDLGQQVLVCRCTSGRYRRGDHLAAPSGYRYMRLVGEMTPELRAVDQRGFRAGRALQLLVRARQRVFATTAAPLGGCCPKRRRLFVLRLVFFDCRGVLLVQTPHVFGYRQRRLHEIVPP